MFSFFWKRPKPIPTEVRAFSDRFLGAAAMAIALAEGVAEHAAEIRGGKAPFPALEATGVPTVHLWHFLRLEACLGAIRYGDGSLFELADVGKQPMALAEFLDRKAHLQFPQPSGGTMAHSVQGMWQAYLYLMEAGSKVCDPATDHHLLKARGESILVDLEREAQRSQAWWRTKTDEPLPPTLFDLFFDDLTRKTKSIAISKLFGPHQFDEAPAFIEELLASSGSEMAAEGRLFVDALARAANPDEAAKLTATLRIARFL